MWIQENVSQVSANEGEAKRGRELGKMMSRANIYKQGDGDLGGGGYPCLQP